MKSVYLQKDQVKNQTPVTKRNAASKEQKNSSSDQKMHKVKDSRKNVEELVVRDVSGEGKNETDTRQNKSQKRKEIQRGAAKADFLAYGKGQDGEQQGHKRQNSAKGIKQSGLDKASSNVNSHDKHVSKKME